MRSLITWGVSAAVGGDDEDFPKQQVSYLGKAGDALVHFPYGYHANVPVGELGLLLAPNGNPDARAFLPGSYTSRPTSTIEGETVIYNPTTGTAITFKANGDVEINTSATVKVTAPTATFSGDVEISGDLDVIGATALGSTVTSGVKDISDTHTHVGSPTAVAGSQSDTGVPN